MVAVSRVQKTVSKPTLEYHSASVHRSSPKLNRRKRPMTRGDPDGDADAPAGARPPSGVRHPGRRAARSAAARASARAAVVVRVGRRLGVVGVGVAVVLVAAPRRGRRRRGRRRRRLPRRVGLVVVVRRRRRRGFEASPARGARIRILPRASASRRRSSSMKSSNRSRIRRRVYTACGFKADGASRCRAEPGENGLRELVRAHRGGPRGLEPERGADGQRHSPRRVASSGGAISPRRIWSRPASSRMSRTARR